MELIDTIQGQVEKIVGDVGDIKDDVIGSIMAEVDMWPTWYYEELPGEKRIDYGKVVGFSPLEKNVRLYVNSSPGLVSGDLDNVVALVMSKIINWKKWFPESYEQANFDAYMEEEDSYDSVYLSDYGDGDNGIGEF